MKQNSVHGVSRDHPDGAAIDEFDNRVQLPEVLAGGLHLHPQHPGVLSLRVAHSSQLQKGRKPAKGERGCVGLGKERGGGAGGRKYLELALGGVLEPLGVALVESDDGGGDAEATGRRGPWQGEPERVGADRAAEGGRGGGVGSSHGSCCGPGPRSELGEVECAGRKMDDSFLRTSKMYVARIFKKILDYPSIII